MRFSIITVCRNNLPGLQRTWESIKAQTYAGFEWIVIDGASTDGTAGFLTNLDYDKTSFVSEPDEGLYHAMNKGIKMAKGDYMVFMNSGDLFMSERTLSEVSGIIDSNPYLIFIYGDSIDFDNTGKSRYRKARDHRTVYRGMFTQHQSMFFARSIEGVQIRYSPEYKYSADYQFIIRHIKNCKAPENIEKIDAPLSRFELGGINETRRFLAIKEDFKIRKEDLGLNILLNSTLFLAHYIHTITKQLIPGLMAGLRYSTLKGQPE